jgi:hypothetical protein
LFGTCTERRLRRPLNTAAESVRFDRASKPSEEAPRMTLDTKPSDQASGKEIRLKSYAACAG